MIGWGTAPKTGNAEVDQFLDDLLRNVRNMQSQISALVTISQTAGATYTATEQQMLNDLKTAVNGILEST